MEDVKLFVKCKQRARKIERSFIMQIEFAQKQEMKEVEKNKERKREKKNNNKKNTL